MNRSTLSRGFVAALSLGFAGLNAQSTQAEFASLSDRWEARIADLRALSDRLDKQMGTSR